MSQSLSLYVQSVQKVVVRSNGQKSLKKPYRGQQGFSLVEVSIVTALMILMAIIGLPAVQGYVIENKVPRVAQDLQRFVARLKMTAVGAGATPYAKVDQRVLMNGLRDATVVTVQGTENNQAVAHGLGGRGVGGHGTVLLSPETVPGMGDGSAFRLTLNFVNHAACPTLAAVMQRMASQVSIAGVGAAVVVKNSDATPAVAYNPVLADAQCATGDVNHFVFSFH